MDESQHVSRIVRPFAGGRYAFCLTWEDCIVIEKITGPLIAAFRSFVRTGTARFDHVVEIIRQGLIGAGMERDEANKLVATYVVESPISENQIVARDVLGAGLMGGGDWPDIVRRMAELTEQQNSEMEKIIARHH